MGREAEPVAQNAWYAYLPQAGVTLGLVFLAQGALPELGDAIRKTGLAVVALHLLLGPVLLGVALRRAGEVPDGAAPAEVPEAPVEAGPAPTRVTPPEPEPAPALPPPTKEALARAVGVPELVGLAEEVRQHLEDESARFLAEVARPRAEDARTYAEGIFEAPEDGESVVMAIHRRLPKDRPDLVGDWGPEVQRLEEAIRARVHTLPASVAVPMAESLLAWTPRTACSPRRGRPRSGWPTLRLRRGRVRDVPVRLLGRLACEARIADAAVALAGAWPRSYAAMLDQVRLVATQERAAEEALAEVDGIAARFAELARRTLEQAAAEILNELARTLPRAGSPEVPLASLRFSKVEPEARAAPAAPGARGHRVEAGDRGRLRHGAGPHRGAGVR
ncbi:MAG: hypothetical protein H6730_24780 [Deltaproteobacteria bacterium]|nr:hypothetical protein [Deltaproteobacteria bacterium]